MCNCNKKQQDSQIIQLIHVNGLMARYRKKDGSEFLDRVLALTLGSDGNIEAVLVGGGKYFNFEDGETSNFIGYEYEAKGDKNVGRLKNNFERVRFILTIVNSYVKV